MSERGGVYHIRATVQIDAPAEYVRRVLSDFVHIYRLNPSIIESATLPDAGDGTTYVSTRVLGCAGYFCQELDRVERVQILPTGDLIADIIPEKSGFRSGRTVWHIEDEGESSRVVYQSVMEPDFYIPPIVGKFMVKKSMHTEMQTSFNNLERIANVIAERDWQSDFRPTTLETVSRTPCELAVR